MLILNMTEENPLIYLLKTYPEENWDMEQVSANENVTIEDIKSNPTLKWNWKSFSKNPNITWDFVKKHPFHDWDWVELSMHSCVTPDIVKRNPLARWFWPSMSCNPNLTIEFLRKFKKKNWDWLILTKNGAFTIETILSNSDLPWKLNSICDNPNFKSFVKNHDKTQYVVNINDFTMTVGTIVSKNGRPPYKRKYVTYDALIYKAGQMKHVHERMQQPFFWSSKHISTEFIKTHVELAEKLPNSYVNFDDLSRNPNLTMEIVNMVLPEKWNWYHVSKNEGIMMGNIQENPDKPWSDTLAQNPNMTLEYIGTHDLSFEFLSANKFTKMKERQRRIKDRKNAYPFLVKKMNKGLSRHIVETYL